MNDYFLLFKNPSNKPTERCYHHFGCRESLVYTYAELYPYITDDEPIYFGHQFRRSLDNILPERWNYIYKVYSTICDEIWKGEIPYEILKVKDIPTSYDIWKYNDGSNVPNPELPLIKINRSVQVTDLSLVLYLSWWGKTSSDDNIQRYYLSKKYSDLIPSIDPKSPNRPMNEGYHDPNGPINYIYGVFNTIPGNTELIVKMTDLCNAHKDDYRITSPNVDSLHNI